MIKGVSLFVLALLMSENLLAAENVRYVMASRSQLFDENGQGYFAANGLLTKGEAIAPANLNGNALCTHLFGASSEMIAFQLKRSERARSREFAYYRFLESGKGVVTKPEPLARVFWGERYEHFEFSALTCSVPEAK